MKFIQAGRIRWLVIDRTNWKFGSKNTNLLVLSFILMGVSIPLAWIQLDKRGSSNFTDRKRLIEKALSLYCLKSSMLLADREFIGTQWMGYLLEQGIHFLIRLRKDDYKKWVDSSQAKVWQRKLVKKAMSKRGLGHTFIELDGYQLNYIVMRNPNEDNQDEPLLYFITDRSTAARKLRLERYRDRWSIETCFKHLKTNGFNLEDMHFKNDQKIELMMALVSMAYCLAIREGIISHSRKPIRIKKYKNGRCYLEQSIFRVGLAIIHQVLDNLVSFIYYLLDIFQPKLKTVQ